MGFHQRLFSRSNTFFYLDDILLDIIFVEHKLGKNKKYDIIKWWHGSDRFLLCNESEATMPICSFIFRVTILAFEITILKV